MKLARQEELENLEIKRKIIQEQKSLKVKKDNQKRVVYNEMKRKYSETAEERYARLAKDRANGVRSGRRYGGGYAGNEASCDPSTVLRMLEDRLQRLDLMLKPPTIEVVIKHDMEQSKVVGGNMIRRLRLVTVRETTLIHLSILVALKNGLKEDEWPNFEFSPCMQTNQIAQSQVKNLFLNGNLRAFKFRSTIHEILTALNPGREDSITKLELIYKKKPMPQITLSKGAQLPNFRAMDMPNREPHPYLNYGTSASQTP